jgi:hypothetical protein
MGAIDNTMINNILNATLPTATGGKPTATYWTAGGLSVSAAMKMRLDSTAPTAAAAGTEITLGAGGSGYSAGGFTLGASTAASAQSVTLPSANQSFVAGSGGTVTTPGVVGLDITDSAAVRSWWGLFNGEPISIANGNTFQVAANAVTVTLA